MRAAHVVVVASLTAGAIFAFAGGCSDEIAEVARTGTNATSMGAGWVEPCTIGGKTCAVACDPTIGCIDCKTNANCAPLTPVCVHGACHECGVTADCGAGRACFPKDHTCQVACSANADCGGDQPLCDTVTKACVQCLEPVDCPKDKPICEPLRARCSECASNADCTGAKPICDVEAGLCVQCLVDVDCGAPHSCAGDKKCH